MASSVSSSLAGSRSKGTDNGGEDENGRRTDAQSDKEKDRD